MKMKTETGPTSQEANVSTAPVAESGTVKGDWGFLQLPAEIRNSIYEYAAINETSFSMRNERELYAPPLSLVCRQIRKEYRDFYKDVWKHATRINLHITDYVSDAQRIVDYISVVNHSPEPDYVVQLFIKEHVNDIMLKRLARVLELKQSIPRTTSRKRLLGLRQPRPHPYGTVMDFRPSRFEVYFDPDVISVRALQVDVLRCSRRFAGTLGWTAIEEAFWEALQRQGGKKEGGEEVLSKRRRLT